MPAIDFNPNDLHRLNRLMFAFRVRSEQTSGEHRIRRAGDGYEFMDYRPYTRGDDVRTIDWNVYRRLRQIYVRIQESPRQTSMVFLQDASRSMTFGKPRTKLQQAQLIACGLSFVALRGGDRIFVSSFSDDPLTLAGPISGIRRHRHVVQALEQIPPPGQSRLLKALRMIAARRRLGGLVVILSDFMNVDDLEEAFRLVASAGGRVLAVQTLDLADRGDDLVPGIVHLRDSETGQLLQVRIDEQTLADYRKRLEGSRQHLERRCTSRGHHYVLADTQDDYVEVVSRALRTGAVLR